MMPYAAHQVPEAVSRVRAAQRSSATAASAATTAIAGVGHETSLR